MNRNLYRHLASALCALALLLSLAPAAWAAGSPAVSNNALDNYYEWYGTRSTSFLYANASGGLTRVELIDGEIVVEDYTSSFSMLSQRKLPAELPIWGGFYAGAAYNFLIFGQTNYNESDGVEVIRIVKYDKSWNRLGQASVCGANTRTPFHSGPVRCAEAGGMLYIHTCHEMYQSSDGKNHQANMNLVIREGDMAVTETGCQVGNYYNYVSHSFNQFILTDSEGGILTANQGDGSPRALVIHRMPGMAGQGSMNPGQNAAKGSVQTERFTGEDGDNMTNVQLGGFAETSSGYLMAYAQRRILAEPEQIKVAYISKGSFSVSGGSNSLQIQQLTDNTGAYRAETAPYLVPMGLSGGWVLWNSLGGTTSSSVNSRANQGLCWAPYAADGTVGAVQSLSKAAPLSDCQPIAYNGRAVWYTTEDSAPVFYALDASGVTATPANGSPAPVISQEGPAVPVENLAFTDLSASHWAYQDIMGAVALGAAAGFDDGSFRPDDAVTIPQFCAMVGRVFYPEELAVYQAREEYAGKPWYVPVCDFAWLGALSAAPSLFHYVTDVFGGANHYNDWEGLQDVPLNRYNMALMIEEVRFHEKGRYSLEEENAVLSTITDYNKSAWGDRISAAVAACIKAGILTGMPDGSFSGELTVTRAQACAVINRMDKYING